MKATTKITVTALLCVAALYFLIPVYWLVIAATKSTGDLYGSSGWWLFNPQLFENLKQVFTYNDGIFLRWVGNTLLYAGIGATLSTWVAAACGYALAKFRFRGRETVFNLVLGGVLVPFTALALPLYLLFSQLGLSNTVFAVLLPCLVSPFGVYLCRIYADAAVPDELLEAGRLDGAGEARIFHTVVLRMMAPALVTTFLFEFVGIWNNYFLPLVMLSDTKLYPLTLGLSLWQSTADREPVLTQLTIGGALVSVVPLMIAMVFLQRFWRGGLTQGSVKG
ncbi:carbohydrate ABC transporter permease [Allokutzneria albata]|uniref:Carbohydrate ABC transporter membrane protein 2, CUT1 family n=1 Tax=Allokutzneria albata TaxID=211114 RepID=A0A1H0DBR3_ALLAB|nr:carbohydrate ABC transporter permease [Allokutzneria albata]SDN67592.1 carbohydrate ABC transporter membrane protein 2, CUT1 family [Allokutzneria albata]